MTILEKARVSFIGIGFLIIYCFGAPESRGDEAAELKERFLTEAPRKWSAYWSFAERLQGTWTLVRTDRISNKLIGRTSGEFKQWGYFSVYTHQDLGPDQLEGRAVGKNSSYAFDLRRKTADSQWVLVALDMEVEQGVSKVLDLPQHAVVDTGCPHLALYNHPLPELVNAAEFSLRSVTPLQRTDGQYVRVDFDYSPKKIENNPARGGWLVLDSKRYWVMREYQVEGVWPDGKGTIAGNFEYEENDRGFPIPKRHVMRQKALSRDQGPVDLERVIDFELFEKGKVPESEFMLSAFGLPEPGKKPFSIPWFAVAIVMGLVCLGSALWQQRRRRSSTGEET